LFAKPTTGALAYNYTALFGKALPSLSIADVCYLGHYVPLIAGLFLLIKARHGTRDWGSLIDAVVITVAAAALSWTYLMAPYAHNATLSVPTKLVSIAYPLMDVLLLGMLVRLLVGSGGRAVDFALLSLGVLAVLVTDSIYGWTLLHGGYQTGGLLILGWAAYYALLGASALHPSTRTLFALPAERETQLTGRRIMLLAAASVTVPVVMFTRSLLGEHLDVGVLAVAATLLFALVLLA
jgi:hypothetical protein